MRFLLSIAILLALSLVVKALHAQEDASPVTPLKSGKDSVAESGRVESGWPANPDNKQVNEIWRRLVALISKHGGYVGKSDFEHAFAMKFTARTPAQLGGNFYSTTQAKSWLLTVGLTDGIPDGRGSVSSNLGVSFRGVGMEESSKNPCLSTDDAFSDLKRAGWSGSYGAGSNFATLFMKSSIGFYQATVFYTPSCVLGIRVSD